MSDFDAVRTRQSAVPWLLFFIAGGCAGALLYFGRQHLDAQTARVAKLEIDLTTATTWGGQAEAQRKQLEQKVQALADEKLALSAEKFELSKGLLHAEAELKQLKTTYDSLEQKMRAEINKGEIRLSQGGGRIQVDLVDKVLFDSGKADLSTRGQEVLTRLGAVLSTVEDKRIQVSGHTDDSPITLSELKEKFPTNWELSAARAVNVVRFLSEKGGVPARRLFAAANAEHEPVAPNATPLGRAQNRRIEILLSPVLTKRDAKPVAAAEKAAAKAPPPAKKPAAKPRK